MDTDDFDVKPRPDPGSGREPVFNAPVLAVVTAMAIIVGYWFQSGPDAMALSYQYGLVPARLSQGEIMGLFTYMLMHGGWMHAIMNAVGALTFAAPVARLMIGVKGLIGFLTLYILCGVIAGGGYALLHIDGNVPLVGASGAVFGLIGAAIRLLGGRGTVSPLTDRRVMSAAAAWIGVNLFIGLTGFAPGMEGASIAWEAHVIGLVAGMILIGPWARFFGRRSSPPPSFDSKTHMSEPESRNGPWA